MSENNELVIETLNKRLAALEAEVSRLKKTSKDVPEDVLAVICATVSAYLGNDGKVQAVRVSDHLKTIILRPVGVWFHSHFRPDMLRMLMQPCEAPFHPRREKSDE